MPAAESFPSSIYERCSAKQKGNENKFLLQDTHYKHSTPRTLFVWAITPVLEAGTESAMNVSRRVTKSIKSVILLQCLELSLCVECSELQVLCVLVSVSDVDFGRSGVATSEAL